MQGYITPLYFEVEWITNRLKLSEFDERHITRLQMIKMRKDAVKSGLIKESEVLEFSGIK